MRRPKFFVGCRRCGKVLTNQDGVLEGYAKSVIESHSCPEPDGDQMLFSDVGP